MQSITASNFQAKIPSCRHESCALQPPGNSLFFRIVRGERRQELPRERVAARADGCRNEKTVSDNSQGLKREVGAHTTINL